MVPCSCLCLPLSLHATLSFTQYFYTLCFPQNVQCLLIQMRHMRIYFKETGLLSPILLLSLSSEYSLFISPVPLADSLSFYTSASLCVSLLPPSHLISLLRVFPISHPTERVQLPSCLNGEIQYVLTSCFTFHLWLIPALLPLSDFLLPAMPVVKYKRIFCSVEMQLDLLWWKMLGTRY